MEGKRRKFSSGEKVRVLRRHLVDKVPVSELCEQERIQPTQFYQWQKQFFENGASAFEPKPSKTDRREARRIEALEAKLRKKDEVIAEILEDHVKLKKELGDL